MQEWMDRKVAKSLDDRDKVLREAVDAGVFDPTDDNPESSGLMAMKARKCLWLGLPVDKDNPSVGNYAWIRKNRRNERR